jgi:phosphoribosylaminoimidazole-succinocarboxamide synthase
VLLIDEIHTPDSSRFWKAESYPTRFANHQEPELYDKEFIRLAYAERSYLGEGQPPTLPPEVWVAAGQLYVSIYELLTGQSFQPAAYPVETRLFDSLQKAGILQ